MSYFLFFFVPSHKSNHDICAVFTVKLKITICIQNAIITIVLGGNFLPTQWTNRSEEKMPQSGSELMVSYKFYFFNSATKQNQHPSKKTLFSLKLIGYLPKSNIFWYYSIYWSVIKNKKVPNVVMSQVK